MNNHIKHILSIGTAVLLLILLAMPIGVEAADKNKKAALTITVRSSPNSTYMSELDIESKEMYRSLQNAKLETAAEGSFFPDIEISLRNGHSKTKLRLERTGSLWDESEHKRIILPKAGSDKLLHLAEALRTHHYGERIPWEEAKLILPNKSMFTVTDLESGLTFHVQRRAGRDHADVQPVTKEDTRIMKQIYQNHWSWKRKAVLVHSDQHWIAASMNGMPHGGDGIPENNFSGHFCIHFHLSSTHKSNEPDITHQVMVNKAAGNLTAYFDSATPHVLAKTFIEVMNHQDKDLLKQLSTGLPEQKLAYFVQQLESLRSIRVQKQAKPKNSSMNSDSEITDSLIAEIKLPITIESKNHSPQSMHYQFLFKRESTQSPWRFEDIQH